MVNWQDKANAERLLAAIIASHDNKINCREVARLFGDGATYDAIENYLRKPKKQASALKEAASGREAPSVTSSRSKKAKTIADSPTKTPVKGGRVTKTKKATTPKIKAELLQEDSVLFNVAVNGAGSDEAEEEEV